MRDRNSGIYRVCTSQPMIGGKRGSLIRQRSIERYPPQKRKCVKLLGKLSRQHRIAPRSTDGCGDFDAQQCRDDNRNSRRRDLIKKCSTGLTLRLSR